jgi:DNA-binding transcriptional LysR family regulator
LNYRHLEVFYAVMTNGTVTEAARQLGVSQPSVTTTLKQAEAKLGLQLFLREGGRLIPTAEARLLFEEADRAHEALNAIESLARRLRVGRGGHVRIAAVPTVSHELLPDAIEIFESRHSGFQYSVTTMNSEDIVDDLDRRKGTFHLGFSFGSHTHAAIATSDVGEAEILAVIPANWDLARNEDLNLSQLEGKPFVSGFDQTALALECRRLFAEANIDPETVSRSHSHYLAGALVQRGVGYSLLDALTVRALLRDRHARPVVVRRVAGHPSMPIVAMFASQAQLGNAAQLFIDCFREAFDNLETAIGGMLTEAAPAIEV